VQDERWEVDTNAMSEDNSVLEWAKHMSADEEATRLRREIEEDDSVLQWAKKMSADEDIQDRIHAKQLQILQDQKNHVIAKLYQTDQGDNLFRMVDTVNNMESTEELDEYEALLDMRGGAGKRIVLPAMLAMITLVMAAVPR
jgi:hypothetical protein